MKPTMTIEELAERLGVDPDELRNKLQLTDVEDLLKRLKDALRSSMQFGLVKEDDSVKDILNKFDSVSKEGIK